MTPISFLLIFSAIFLLNSASGTLEENCKKIAGQTVTYNFCMQTLGADPNSKDADLQSLGVIASKLTLANGTYTQSYIKKLLQDSSGGDPKIVEALKSCDDEYQEMLPDDVEDAIKGFQFKRYNDANIHLSAVMDSVDDCEMGFKDFGKTSPLSKLNDSFKNLAAIALHISAILLRLS